MAITSSAKKAIRVDERKRVFNTRRRRDMKMSVKEVRELVKQGKAKEAQKKMPGVYKALDEAAKRGVIKKNTASRKKSRLTKLVKENL